MRSKLKPSAIVFLLAICALVATAAKAQTRPFTEGNFFVGAEPYPMYVEYFLPAKATHKFPIILIHGGVHTGAGFVSTPD
ncbi:MAG: hypothetical protein ACRD4Y_05065, partial [Candidatus Acidiferrales bacterium]